MKATFLAVVLLFSCLSVSSIQAFPWENNYDTFKYYFLNSTHTVNQLLGYRLATSPDTDNITSVSLSDTGDLQTWVAVRVWLRDNGSETELTDGSYNINVTRTVNGIGLQTVDWTKATTTTLTLGQQAVRVNAYMKIGSGSWSHRATFVSSLILSTELRNTTWTFNLYTYRFYLVGSTNCYLYWGNTTAFCKIDNIQTAQPSPWELQEYHLQHGDFIQFVVTPWSYYIGNVCYGLAVFFMLMTTYLKYGDIRIPIIMLWFGGGAGGVLTLLIPALGLHLAWFLLAFAMATTLYALVR